MVVRESNILQCVPPNISSAHLAHSHHSIIDCVPYAVPCVPMTVLHLPQGLQDLNPLCSFTKTRETKLSFPKPFCLKTSLCLPILFS